MEIRYSKSALAALLRSDKRDLIRRKLEAFAVDPEFDQPNITRLKGRPEWRLRVQNWRVVFIVDGDVMVVRAIGPRGRVYGD